MMTTTHPPIDESRTRMSSTAVVDLPVIDLVHPLPGFPDLSRFALVQLDADGVLCALRSLEDADLRFLVVPPGHFFPDYAPVISDETVADLGIEDVAEVLVLVILTAGDTLADTTANLLAPVVVNTRTRAACQVVLDDLTLSTARPVLG